ncbi:MAG: right-handed parallel beta-helix repeat-containing protein [bacterium]
MKIISASLILFSLFARTLHAGNISGVLVSGTHDTLKLADSPFTATGNISVLQGDTLTIEPGVVIRFENGVDFTMHGTLLSTGTSTDTIRFTSNSGSPNPGDWNGLLFTSTGGGTLKYMVIEYAATGITTSNSALTIRNSSLRANNNGIECQNSSSPLIDSNRFTNNSNTAIRCTGASPIISKNSIYGNIAVSSALFCGLSSNPKITQNLIYQNGSSAIECAGGSDPEIWQNVITLNNFGITISDSSAPTIENNIISGNTNIGVAVNDAAGLPTVKYNNVWSNSAGDFFGTPAGVGVLNTTNANGDASDSFFNISLDPQFVNPGIHDYHLQISSPCIDAGNPANPAGIIKWGNAPDIGSFEYDGAVPVELISFVFDAGALKWITASETNNFGFAIERSLSEKGEFSQVGFVKGHGTTTTPRLYEFRDSIETGIYFYRLRQIDTDGSFELSATIRAVYTIPTTFSLEQNYPNPFNPTTTISFNIPEESSALNQPASLTIYNALGQKIQVLFNERKSPGFHQLTWNGVDKLGKPSPSGVYFYELRFGESKLTKRMLLIR